MTVRALAGEEELYVIWCWTVGSVKSLEFYFLQASFLAPNHTTQTTIVVSHRTESDQKHHTSD